MSDGLRVILERYYRGDDLTTMDLGQMFRELPALLDAEERLDALRLVAEDGAQQFREEIARLTAADRANRIEGDRWEAHTKERARAFTDMIRERDRFSEALTWIEDNEQDGIPMVARALSSAPPTEYADFATQGALTDDLICASLNPTEDAPKPDETGADDE